MLRAGQNSGATKQQAESGSGRLAFAVAAGRGSEVAHSSESRQCASNLSRLDGGRLFAGESMIWKT